MKREAHPEKARKKLPFMTAYNPKMTPEWRL